MKALSHLWFIPCCENLDSEVLALAGENAFRRRIRVLLEKQSTHFAVCQPRDFEDLTETAFAQLLTVAVLCSECSAWRHLSRQR